MIGQGLYSFLSSQTAVVQLCKSRIYPDVAPHDADYPFLVYSRVGEDVSKSLSGPTGLIGARMQIDAYGLTHASADQLQDAVRRVVDEFAETIRPGEPQTMGTFTVKGAWRDDHVQDIYHPPITADDVGLHRVRQDYWIFYEEE